MHVLHIDRMLFAPGGVTSYVQTLAALQRRRGDEVSFFGCDDPGRPGPAGPRGSMSLPEFVDFTATRNPLALTRMIHDVQAANSLARFLRLQQPIDIAHLHGIYHHLTPSILPVLARRGIPMVMTVHDYRLACPAKHFLRGGQTCMDCWPNRFWHATRCGGAGGAALAIESYFQRFFRRYIRWIEFFICPGPFMADVLRAAGVPGSKLVVAPNVVEPPAMPSGVARRDDQLLYVGRLSREKGPDLMLELAAALGQVQVVIVGGGPMLEPLRQDIARRCLRNVTLAGSVPHKDIGRYLAEATAVVLPSRCLENSPQTMLEAMSTGRCVIAADHPTLRHWINDRETGRTFPSGDAAALATVVAEVLREPAQRKSMEQAAGERVKERHDSAAIIEQLVGLYREAAARCALRW
ncbi:MAG: glycosyltransferase family 4 protein [Phycisphaerae bacterium]